MKEPTGLSGAVRRAKNHERQQNMKSMCLYCRNGAPVELRRDPVSNIAYWAHGEHPCKAGPIRDRAIKSRHGPTPSGRVTAPTPAQ